ncbi:MAG: molybdenum cofactor biosynthesis protein MoaE [Saprospiraceae bacterium]|nr:molybdenum cofactor biosynthesis protein MoaE [Saprospiraceae bacterium]MBK7809708.1 molybdenum cofactor biosynthesis protein MoaE [Saprospiraceae bacterium]MBK9632182.1 molybdenum cofactor biosynthesis protein MoaE [Saprospiraceae bacterium]
MNDHKIKNIFVEGAISSQKIAESIQSHSSKKEIGGHSIFLGQVREDVLEAGKVIQIEYTAYVDMALEKMQIIREDVFSKYPLSCMHVYHSLGKVNAGEICLFVFTSSKHRKPAIDACAELVERIKQELPIWGKEILENENSQWKENN